MHALTSFDAISDLANSAGEAKAATLLLRMTAGADRRVNATAVPASSVAPRAAVAYIFMVEWAWREENGIGGREGACLLWESTDATEGRSDVR